MKRFFKIAIVVLFIAFLLTNNIVSHGDKHLHVCRSHDCDICTIIAFAQYLNLLSFAIVVFAIVSFSIYFLFSEMYKELEFFITNSLIFQKVEFNE